MPFKKGQITNPKGKIPGTKNNEDLSSLKMLLHNAFVRNHSAAYAKLDAMFQGDDIKDFKWICEIKASLEPKQVNIKAEVNLVNLIQEVETLTNNRLTINQNQ